MLRQWCSGKTINSYSGLRGLDSHWVLLILGIILNFLYFLSYDHIVLVYFNFGG